MLHLLLGKQWHMYLEFAEFLQQSKYKVINKDQWCNILEFSRTISGDLSNYDVDGACKCILLIWIKQSKLKNFNWHSLFCLIHPPQGPFCWTNSWNGCDKNAAKSAEATSQSLEMKTQSENIFNSTTKTPRIYFFHSFNTKQKFHQPVQQQQQQLPFLFFHIQKRICVFSVCSIVHIRFDFWTWSISILNVIFQMRKEFTQTTQKKTKRETIL